MSKQNELAQLADAVTVDGSNVGIGTASPAGVLHANSSGHTKTYITSGTSNDAQINFGDSDDNDIGGVHYDNAQNSMKFLTSTAERMRLDSSGRLLVDTTNISATAQSGNSMTYDNGRLEVQKYRLPALRVGIYTDGFGGYSGNLLEFYSGGSNIGQIGSTANDLNIYSTATGHNGLRFHSVGILPTDNTGAIIDNDCDLGINTHRFKDIYASNGTINTSDFNEKQDIASLTATEMLVGKRISVLFKTFRWKDSVAEKGDNARTHTGVIAQDVQAAFTAEGLDAGDYALFISTTWWETQTDVPAVEAVAEVTDEDGNVTTEAVEAVDAYTRTDNYDTEAEAPEGATSKTRMGIRYPELLSFVAAYNEQRFASIEARLTALEA